MSPHTPARCCRVACVWLLIIQGCLGSPSDGSSESPEEVEAANVAVQAAALTVGCTPESNTGREYLFCTAPLTWSQAQTDCRAQGLELVRIDDSSENGFVRTKLQSESWIGGSDIGTEGRWLWSDNGAQFWSGGSGGYAPSGRFEDWASSGSGPITTPSSGPAPRAVIAWAASSPRGSRGRPTTT